MFPYSQEHLTLLLEQEADSVGNLSQHLAVLGITWSVFIVPSGETSDPAMRRNSAYAWCRRQEQEWFGCAHQEHDLGGEWTYEEAILQLLELALRDLWSAPFSTELTPADSELWEDLF